MSKRLRKSNNNPFAEDPPDMLKCARWWHAKGFNVIPIQNDAFKRPLCEWTGRQTQRQTLEELERLMTDTIRKYGLSFNIAVVLGEYDGKTRAVVDLDKNEYVPKFESYFAHITRESTIMTKPSKGLHAFLYLPAPIETHHLEGKGVKIDIQCQGAYVIVPPSLHATARNAKGARVRYAFYSNQIDEIQEYTGNLWLDIIDFIRACIDKNFTPESEVLSVDDILKPRAEHEGRNDAGIKFACLLFETLKDDPDAEDKVWAKFQEWNANHMDPMPEKELRTIFNSANEHRYLFKFDRKLTREELEVKQPLTAEMEAFLRSPDLINKILDIIHLVIVGENELCLLTYFLGISAAFIKRPFGLIIISLPGHGKSYIEEMMATCFPPERLEQPTSVSEQVVNYLGGNYSGLIVRIDELFGTEEGMPSVRVWMTNGRLERWITDADTHKPIKLKVEGCPVFWTSTVETLEPQYGSRNWICHADPNVKQTRAIHSMQDANSAMPEALLTPRKEASLAFLRSVSKWLMQNAKEVVIPFRYTFPYKTGRMRREKPKFSNLIKSIVQVHQLQRKTFEYKGKRVIIASEEDFNIAKKITEKYLKSTLLILDDMEIKILDWARENKRLDQFKVKDVSQALQIPYNTVYARLKDLAKNGYIEEIEAPFERKALAFQLTELGVMEELVNIQIYDKGERLIQLYNSLSDPQKEAELLSLLAAYRNEEPYLDPDDASTLENAATSEKQKRSDSKKEPDSSKLQMTL